MLREILQKNWFRPKAVIGFWPANSVGDDIRLFTDESRAEQLATFFTLRQQLTKTGDKPNMALADFVAPLESGRPDYIGGFVVTAGLEENVIAERFERLNDDYSAILVKALADRFAEAFAEAMHERVRKEFWGYAPDESFTAEQLVQEPYRGIRPAPGYPAQPDHTEKTTLFHLLNARQRIGVSLTESYAVWPGSSVSASISATRTPTISASPRSSATRSPTTPAARAWRPRGERWLGPILNYTPGSAAAEGRAA